MKKENNTLLIVLAIIAALLAVFNAYVALRQVSDLASITGYQVLTNVSKGNITLSIPSNVQIEFVVNLINWSNGSVISGFSNATLVSTFNASIQVRNGTWENGTGQGRDSGLVLRNSGNVNVSVNLTSLRNKTDFFLPINLPEAAYMWNVSNNNTLTTTCGIAWQYPLFNVFKDVNTSGDIVCKNLSTYPGQNALRIDILLMVPSTAQKTTGGPPTNGSYTDTIIAVAEASAG